LTVTVNVQVGPADEVTVTVVVPTGKKDPEAGVAVTVPQLPVVVGVKFTMAPHWLGSLFTVMFEGQVSVHGLAIVPVNFSGTGTGPVTAVPGSISGVKAILKVPVC